MGKFVEIKDHNNEYVLFHFESGWLVRKNPANPGILEASNKQKEHFSINMSMVEFKVALTRSGMY